MRHLGYEHYQFCINCASGLTLAYFTTMSNLISNEFIWENWGYEHYQFCINCASGLTLAYFTTMSNLSSNVFIWERFEKFILK